MARKKAEKMPATAAKPGTKPVRLDLPRDAHRVLRLAAAANGMSMAAYARDIIVEHLSGKVEDLGTAQRVFGLGKVNITGGNITG
jgi:plasmid stability protein